MMPVVGVVTDVMNAHLDQTPLAGALKNAGFKIRGENLGQEGKNLKLHAGILPLVCSIRKPFKQIHRFSLVFKFTKFCGTL
jgi:hypothetical protein